MKVPAALVTLALAGAAVAQNLPPLPQCAQPCANKFLQGGIGNCGKDVACICADQSFIGDIACCLVGDCDSAGQSAAVSYAASLCSAFHVTTLPTAVSCSTTPSSSATTTPNTASTTNSGSPTGSASTSGPTAAGATTSHSSNFGPRPTAAAGLGALGGLVAAVALL